MGIRELFLHSVHENPHIKLIIKSSITLQNYFLIPFMSFILKSKANECYDRVECIIRLAYNFENHLPLLRRFSIKPAQIYTEILHLAKIIQKTKT